MMTDSDDETFTSCNPRNQSFFFHVNVLGEVKENIMS